MEHRVGENPEEKLGRVGDRLGHVGRVDDVQNASGRILVFLKNETQIIPTLKLQQQLHVLQT